MFLRLFLPLHTISQMSMIPKIFIPNRIEKNLRAKVSHQTKEQENLCVTALVPLCANISKVFHSTFLFWQFVVFHRMNDFKKFSNNEKIKVSIFRIVGIPGNFLYISKNFRGTDIHHSDIKNALVQIKNFFCSLKIIFQNSQNFFRRNACEIKIFSQFITKIEKLMLGLSKHHNKMLKMRPEMLKIGKKKIPGIYRDFLILNFDLN